MRVQIRGNPQPAWRGGGGRRRRGDRRTGADFGLPPDAPEAERRKRLASWISNAQESALRASRGQPALAGPLRSRAWSRSPSDLGFNGGVPSHPELLDWLAAEMVARGWSLKAMHRLIVTSADLSPVVAVEPIGGCERDAGDRLLWRKAPIAAGGRDGSRRDARRLGQLDPRLGGPSFRDHEVVQSTRYARRALRGGRPRTPGLEPAHAVPRLGSRRPEPVPRRLRLPRSLDDRAPPRGHDHAAPGTVAS